MNIPAEFSLFFSSSFLFLLLSAMIKHLWRDGAGGKVRVQSCDFLADKLNQRYNVSVTFYFTGINCRQKNKKKRRENVTFVAKQHRTVLHFSIVWPSKSDIFFRLICIKLMWQPPAKRMADPRRRSSHKLADVPRDESEQVLYLLGATPFDPRPTLYFNKMLGLLWLFIEVCYLPLSCHTGVQFDDNWIRSFLWKGGGGDSLWRVPPGTLSLTDIFTTRVCFDQILCLQRDTHTLTDGRRPPEKKNKMIAE